MRIRIVVRWPQRLTGNEPARAAPSEERIAHALPSLVPLRTRRAA